MQSPRPNTTTDVHAHAQHSPYSEEYRSANRECEQTPWIGREIANKINVAFRLSVCSKYLPTSNGDGKYQIERKYCHQKTYGKLSIINIKERESSLQITWGHITVSNYILNQSSNSNLRSTICEYQCAVPMDPVLSSP